MVYFYLISLVEHLAKFIMKNQILIIVAFLSFAVGFSQTLYTADGTLTNHRRVEMASRNLTFNPFTANSQIFFNGVNGFVGLGTTSPLSRLHLALGDFRLDDGKLTIGDQFTTTNEANIDFGLKSTKSIVVNPTTTDHYGEISIVYGGSFVQMAVAKCNGCYSSVSGVEDVVVRGNSAGSFIISNDRAGDIKFTTRLNTVSGTLSKVAMLIDNEGNIGIGTETPDAKLAVNGLIHTKEVKVDLTGWPDYVFEENYDLPTIEEVEKHIKEKGYLPEMPSAAEVEENGVELGEMNKLLLQKVEELTLYIIQMNKEIELLKANAK